MALLSLVDSLIVSRLQLIKFNYPPLSGKTEPNRQPIQVFPYAEERTKGSTKYPCFAVDRIELIVRHEDKRPDHEIFEASDTLYEPPEPEEGEEAFSFPVIYDKDGNALEAPSGPASFTRRPFPTPIDLVYEIHAVASVKLHYDFLQEMLFQAFPPGFQTEVTNAYYKQYALFSLIDSINFDDLEKPEFRRVFLYRVSGLWLERVENYESLPIITTDYEPEIINYGDVI